MKKREDRRRAATQPVYDKIWEVRRNAEALGFPKATRDQRRWMNDAGLFATKTFADAFGLSLRDGWNILCCTYPSVGIYYDEDSNTVTGWAVEYNA